MGNRSCYTAVYDHDETQTDAAGPERINATLRAQLEGMAAADGNVLTGNITLRVEREGGLLDRHVRVIAEAAGMPADAAEPAPKSGWRPTVLVDFDGVIHRYSKGWHDGTVYDDPMPGAKPALEVMAYDGYEVVIFSTRDADQIADALQRWGFPAYRITNIKEAAVAQIDDRAIRFTDWPQAASELRKRYPVRW